MDVNEQPLPSSSNAAKACQNVDGQLDLVGGPFSVIESDPGVFTALTRKLGIRNIELVEMYDIEPWAVDHLNPRGLIFCFLWRKDSHRPADFDDPAAERVWFANQLSDDACASLAILNIVLNCPDVDIGDSLREFKMETEKMSPVMKGLAITNSSKLRQAHNSLARPADHRGALYSLAATTLEEEKLRLKSKTQRNKQSTKPPPAKRAKISEAAVKEKKRDKGHSDDEDGEEAYHFIGYVPAYGKVWELDGLKSGPLEVGELPSPLVARPASTSVLGQCYPSSSGWMDVVRPALRMKMKKYGGSAEGGSNIRFSLLAIVDGLYEKASDELEFLKRERVTIERRMGNGWEKKVDRNILESIVSQRHTSQELGTTHAKDFGARKMKRDLEIMEMPEENLTSAWEACVQNAVRAKVAVDDELSKAARANTDHIKRTFDYEPFLKEYVKRLHSEGLLNTLLGQDDNGRKNKEATQRNKRSDLYTV